MTNKRFGEKNATARIRSGLRACFPVMLGSVFALTLGMRAPQVFACSLAAIPVSHAVFGESTPPNGAIDVAPDAAFGIKLSPTEPGTGTSTPIVTLTDLTTGQLVAGEVTKHSGYVEPYVRFKPAALLEPGHDFLFEAVSTLEEPVGESPLPDSDAPRAEFTFSTGSALLPPLALIGRLEAQLQSTERAAYHDEECNDPCGCPYSGRQLGTKGIVKLPGATGGQVGFGYYAIVMATADTPFDFNVHPVSNGHVFDNGGTYIGETPGTIANGLDHLDVTDRDYKPCFAAEITDFSGKRVSTESVCLEETVRRSERVEEGCNIRRAGANAHDTSRWMAWAVVALVVVRRKRWD